MYFRAIGILVLAGCLAISQSFAGSSAPRTFKDVALVVDKHKGAFYALYVQALRAKPRLKGEISLSISIAPDGKVTRCAIASSTLHDADFEKRLVERFSTIQFGAKGREVYNNPAYLLAQFFPAK